MHEIKIYGYISNVAEKSDKEVSLLDVQEQLKLANGEDILCRINSHGGDAEEGFAIYYELRRYAKENNANIKTFAESRLGSIATIIFLAGDKRELTSDLQPFVHKAYFPELDELTDSQKLEINTLNNRIATHYASHTDLTFDEALSLMEAETNINTEEAKAMRFATDIEQVFRPVALKRFINKNEEEMNKNTKSVGILAKAEAFLKSVGIISNAKIVSTADEMEIDFYELDEDAVVEVGAKAKVDGKDADGSYVMKTGETYVFVAGELTEIIEVEEVVSEDLMAMQSTIDELTAKLEEVTAQALKQAQVISNYKNIVSKNVKTEPATAPKNTKVEEGLAKSAVANFINKKPLTKK